MRSIYYKGELGTGRKSKAQIELDKEEVRFRVRRGKFRVVFDDIEIPDSKNLKPVLELDKKNKFDFENKFETNKK